MQALRGDEFAYGAKRTFSEGFLWWDEKQEEEEGEGEEEEERPVSSEDGDSFSTIEMDLEPAFKRARNGHCSLLEPWDDAESDSTCSMGVSSCESSPCLDSMGMGMGMGVGMDMGMEMGMGSHHMSLACQGGGDDPFLCPAGGCGGSSLLYAPDSTTTTTTTSPFPPALEGHEHGEKQQQQEGEDYNSSASSADSSSSQEGGQSSASGCGVDVSAGDPTTASNFDAASSSTEPKEGYQKLYLVEPAAGSVVGSGHFAPAPGGPVPDARFVEGMRDYLAQNLTFVPLDSTVRSPNWKLSFPASIGPNSARLKFRAVFFVPNAIHFDWAGNVVVKTTDEGLLSSVRLHRNSIETTVKDNDYVVVETHYQLEVFKNQLVGKMRYNPTFCFELFLLSESLRLAVSFDSPFFVHSSRKSNGAYRMKAWEKGKDGESSSEPARHVGGQLPVSSPDEAQRILREYNVKKQLPQAESVVVWRVPAGSTQLFPFSGPSMEELVTPPY